ncbi:hypothetical protein PY365_16715 [Roseiarcaceae bacterium H3SJ34-1]|uniref:hypothetical protein n=1 Tax=Terripilifer ovatus TaxID=3032367 RepID=UPI003AB99F3D|nr:hypothetical protein [Roseiarcaceae bacterium H3SJ34-1]
MDDLYNSAERDGLTIGALANSSGLDPLLGSEGVRFDAQKLNWIGSIGKLQNVCATWHESAVRSIDDVRKQEVIVAGAGATTNTVVIPNILNKLLGTKFKVVAGYDRGSGLTMAVESRETDGIKRTVLELILMRQEMGRPFAAPPGVATERVNMLRAGFDATMKDPAFLAEAKRGNLDVDPLTGAQIDALLAKAYGSPQSAFKEASILLSPPGSSRP